MATLEVMTRVAQTQHQQETHRLTAAENEASRRAHPTQQLLAGILWLDGTVGAVTTATAARGDRARSFIFHPGPRQASTLQERGAPLDRMASRSQLILCQGQRTSIFEESSSESKKTTRTDLSARLG